MIDSADYSKAHSTKTEIKVINRLGTYSNVRQPRAVLLAGYLMGAYKRTKWGKIESLEIIDHVTELLVNAIPKSVEVPDGRS